MFDVFFMKRLAIVVICVLLLRPAVGRTRSFKPVLINMVGALEVEDRYRKQRLQRAGSSTLQSTRNEWRQQLDLTTAWYVYHPLFLQMTLGGKLGLRQERHRPGGDGWRNGAVEEYALQGIFLPRHKYNLAFRINRKAPWLSSALPGYDDIRMERNEDLLFDYHYRPWRWSARYGSRHISGDIPRKTDFSVLNFHYSKEDYAVFTGLYQHRNSHRQEDISRQDTLEGSAVLTRPTWSYAASFQAGRDAGLDERRNASLRHKLEMKLPHGFTFKGNYRRRRERVAYAVGPSLAREQSYTDKGVLDLTLDQQLYDSLHSRLQIKGDNLDTLQGGFASRKYLFKSHYDKHLPWRGRLQLDFGAGNTVSERQTQNSFLLEERHSAWMLANDLVTSQVTLEKGSLTVAIVDDPANNPASFQELTEGVHYRVEQENSGALRVVFFPAQIGVDFPLVDVTGADLQLRYRLQSGNYVLRANRLEGGGTLSLGHGFWQGQYHVTRIDQRLESGSFFLGDLRDQYREQQYGMSVWSYPFRSGILLSEKDAIADLDKKRIIFSELDYQRRLGGKGTMDVQLGVEHKKILERKIDKVAQPLYGTRGYYGDGRLKVSSMLVDLDLSASFRKEEGVEQTLKYDAEIVASRTLPRIGGTMRYAGSYQFDERRGIVPLEFLSDTLNDVVYRQNSQDQRQEYQTREELHRVSYSQMLSGHHLRLINSFEWHDIQDDDRGNGHRSTEKKWEGTAVWKRSRVTVDVNLQFTDRKTQSLGSSGTGQRQVEKEILVRVTRKL